MPLRRRGPTVTVQRGGPGLVRTMARTAVISGTATATSRAVGNAMNNRAQSAYQPPVQQPSVDAATTQSQMELEQLKAQMAAMQAQQTVAATPMPAAATPAAGNDDLLERLQKLADLKAAGALTDEEFQLAKAKVLAG